MATSSRFVAKNGLDNNANTITNIGASGSSLALSGANALTITTTGTTNVTFPTSGTLATTASLPNVGDGILTLAVSGTGLSGSATFTANQTGNSTFTVTSNATSSNTASTIVARDGSGNFSAGTITASLSGNATSATNATNTAITDDTLTATSVYPTWVTANTGNLPQKTTGSKFSFVPSTGVVTATQFSGSGAGLTNIPNGALTNSSVTIGTTAISLGSSSTTLAGLTSVTSTSFTGALTGNASTATTLATGRTFSVSGDATGTSGSFDGSANATIPVTLATVNSNVGQFAVVTVTAKGLVTSATNISGDATTSGAVLTLATVNSSPQTDTFRKVTVNGKGLVTATSAVSSSDITTALGYTPVNKAGDTMTGLLILSGDPTAALGAATKQYVDNVSAGVNVHAACETATSAPLASCTYSNGTGGVGATLTATANGALGTIGGYTGLTAGSRLLVKDQANAIQNGIYNVTQLGSAGTPWILTRATDFDGSPVSEVEAGDMTYIQEGTNGGTQWVQTTIGTGVSGSHDYVVLGTDNVVFTQFAGSGTYTAGSGINISTNVISNTGVLSNVAGTGISVSGATGNVTISNTGVTSLVAGSNISVSGATGNVTVSVTGTVPTATTATNIAGGATGNVPYQSAAGTTSFVTNAAGVLQAATSGATPAWTTAPTLTGTNFGGIPNGALTNSSVTIGSTNIALGATATTLAGLTSVSATTFTGAFSGNATTATTSTNISGGAAGSLPYQSSANTTSMLAAGTVNQVLVSGTTPSWTGSPSLTALTLSGALTADIVSTTTGGSTASTRLYVNSPTGQTAAIARFMVNGTDVASVSAGGVITGTSSVNTTGGVAVADGSAISFSNASTNTRIAGSNTSSVIGVYTGGTERFRFGSAGELLIGGTSAGTAGQALISGGTGAAPSWSSSITGSASLNVLKAGDTMTGNLILSGDGQLLRPRAASTAGIPGLRIENNAGARVIEVLAVGSTAVTAYGVTPGNAVINTATGSSLNFSTGDLLRMTIASDGNVGINSSSPGAKLDVRLAGDPVIIPTTTTLYNNTDVVARFSFANDPSSITAGVGAAIGISGVPGRGESFVVSTHPTTSKDSSNLSLWTSNGGVAAQAMTIDATGNVGVGTTTPAALLNASTNKSGGPLLMLDSYMTADSSGIEYRRRARGTLASPAAVATGDRIGTCRAQAYDGTTFRSVTDIASFVETYTTTDNVSGVMTFSTRPTGVASTNTERMRITSAGDIGIGTSSPSNYGAGYASLAVNGSTGGIIDSFSNGTRAVSLFSTTTEGRLDIFGTRSLNVYAGGSQRFQIDTNGYAGLGTPAQPSSALFMMSKDLGSNNIVSVGVSQPNTAVGAAHGAEYAIFEGLTKTAYFRGYRDGSGDAEIAAGLGGGGALRLSTNGSEKARLTSTGDLLIGATSNSFGGRLVVQKASSATIDVYSVDTSEAKLKLFNANNNSAIGSGSGGQLVFYANSSTTERMRLDTVGNLGLAVTSPGARLDIANSSTTNQKAVQIVHSGGSAGSVGASYGLYLSSTANNNASTSYGVYVTMPTTGVAISSMAAAFMNSGGATADTYGVLGQSTQIDTNGPGTAYGGYFKTLSAGLNTNGSTYALRAENAAATGANAWGARISTVAGAATITPLSLVHAGTEIFRVNSAGNLNINGVLTEASTIRVKKNVRPIQNALQTVLGLQGVVYDMKDDSAFNQHGLIAEEVQKVLPNVVYRDEDGEVGGVQYARLVAVLIEGMKEQEARIKALEAIIAKG